VRSNLKLTRNYAVNKNLIILFLLIFSNGTTYSQDKEDKSLEYYNEGLKMFQEKKYVDAESLFILSAELLPHPNTYYNLALTKLYLEDTCGFCENIKLTSLYGDADAGKLFLNKCLKQDTIIFKNHHRKDTVLATIITEEICTIKTNQQFIIKDLKNEKITAFYINEKNNSIPKDKDYSTTFPNLKQIPLSKVVCDLVDQLPQFPSGEEELMNFLTNNLSYPIQARDNGIQGKISIKFTIDEIGQISSIEIVKGIGGGCNEETIRVIKLMPKWIPAIRHGKNVKVNYQMNVSFRLS
jgi:TonB family protein